MKKTIFILNVLFIMTSPLLANPADILTDKDIQDINDANDWCVKYTPEKNSMDGRRCHVITTYPKTALNLAATISNSCQSGEVNR